MSAGHAMAGRARGALLAGVAVVAVALAAWLGLDTPAPPPAPGVVVLPPPAARTVAGPSSTAPPALPASLPTRPAVIACPQQQLTVHRGTLVEPACVSATRSSQRGSVRRYSVEAQAPSRWSLQVEMAGGRAHAVRLERQAIGAEPAQRHECRGPACAGVWVGEPDATGRRPLMIESLRLVETGRADGDAVAASESLRLDARLAIAPDAQQALPGCTDEGLTLLAGEGPSAGLGRFCALGGAGVELLPDGGQRLVFHDLDGRALVVSLAADGTLASVRLGRHRCQGAACGGVVTQVAGDAADPLAGREVAFAGTQLQDDSRPGSAGGLRVSGRLTVPAQP